MKRRIFLSAASTVGIVGAVSSTSLITSTYSSISTSVLLEEFSTPTRRILDKFFAEVTQNVESLGLDKKIANQLAMPVQITRKDVDGSITFKNKLGDYISLSVSNDVEKIQVSKTK